MKKLIFITVLFLTTSRILLSQTNCNQTCNQTLAIATATKFPSLSNVQGWQNITNNQRVRITFSYTITPIGQDLIGCCANCNNGGNLMAHKKIRLQATIKCEAQMKSLIGNTWNQTSVFKPDFEIDFNNFFFNYKINSLVPSGALCPMIGDCTTSNGFIQFSPPNGHFPQTQNFDQLVQSGWYSYPYHIYRLPNVNNHTTIFFDTEVQLSGVHWFAQLPNLTGKITCRLKKGNNWINMGDISL